uniref:Chemosensory protein 4 n=1 Tax=Tropidothorax elegans TaxID=2233830 RepID=A0A2Z5EM75_9HEMI|nr:chemosensory protein 4 [Tropidothorax elegans]
MLKIRTPLGFAVSLIFLVGRSEATQWQEMDEETLYRFIFDDVDVDHIILNDRICNVYLRCFYSTGPCTNLAGAIRSKIPEVFSTVCGKCTDKQKAIWHHILHIFIPRRPDEWKKILAIYDPDGSYWPNIKAFMDKPPPTYED